MHCDRIWRNAHVATLVGDSGLGLVPDGLIACRNGRITYAGPQRDAPADLEATEDIDCQGRLVTPGLIDCHTHLVYAGNRAREFEQRLNGVSYADISRQGGGILSTVTATRAASEAQLVAEALPRLDALLAEGVTTVEIKSGYGLSLEHERKQLRAARQLADERRIAVSTTFLG
ncbi:MAG TPA: imidazolonepropionase, partial [Steroidobacteraceae bacterium]|nr:imidazolonepropionase [Steroidobacteraceae bacterium]